MCIETGRRPLFNIFSLSVRNDAPASPPPSDTAGKRIGFLCRGVSLSVKRPVTLPWYLYYTPLVRLNPPICIITIPFSVFLFFCLLTAFCCSTPERKWSNKYSKYSSSRSWLSGIPPVCNSISPFRKSEKILVIAYPVMRSLVVAPGDEASSGAENKIPICLWDTRTIPDNLYAHACSFCGMHAAKWMVISCGDVVEWECNH